MQNMEKLIPSQLLGLAIYAVVLLASSGMMALGQHRSSKTAPHFSSVPDTNFSCINHMAGYYADMETDCQAYHMCDTLGKQYSYLCPNNTVFNQRFMVCDHWFHVNCTNSGKYYDLNMRMAGGGQKLRNANRATNFIKDHQEDDRAAKKKIDLKSKMKEKKEQIFRSNQKPRITTPRVTTTPKTPRTSFLKPVQTTQRKVSSFQSFFFKSTTNRPSFSPSSASPLKLRPLTLPRTTTERITTTTTPIPTISTTSVRPATKAPPTSIMPFMFARNSGSRNGFSFTNLVKPPPGHRDIPRNGQHSPFIREFLRQLLTPRKTQSSLNIVDSSSSEREADEIPTLQTPNPRASRKFKFPKGNSKFSFPIQPVIIDANQTPRPIVMTGPRQEDITELESPRKSRKRLTFNKVNNRSSAHGNEAFFIPETKLIPPDILKLPQTNTFRARVFREDNSNNIEEKSGMTMIFPKKKFPTFRGLLLNPNCPECHPGFLTPGKCTPCVKIR